MLTHLKHFKSLYAVLVVLAVVAGVLYLYPPNTIVEYVGVENSYLTTFLIAAIGGLSSITSSVFYAAVATFSSGGANPYLLGLIGGIGIAIGDSIVFGLFSYGIKGIPAGWLSRVERVQTYIDSHPRWTVYVGLFLILGLSPVPNDIVMFALVVLGFEYRKIAPILVLAGISITTITALLGQSLTTFIFG